MFGPVVCARWPDARPRRVRAIMREAPEDAVTGAVIFNREKFREAILYVARESEDDIRFG